ncbi:hypothetical protein LR48_Vigan05g171300 [Vigna angularis]|uniref:Uncharacterized protein n=1 Tax=Phaseolus angularis TaxID=3914 RepID=A0A0L9UMY6_PHAAN|nr:hypothetical protein LR48_Vigan05g171300 [Vigna angularis]
MTNEPSSSSERALDHRTNGRPVWNERLSTRERTLVDLLLLDNRSFHTGRPFVRWSSARSLLYERSFAAGRALVRCWTSARSLLDERSFAAGRALVRHLRIHLSIFLTPSSQINGKDRFVAIFIKLGPN